MIALSEFILHHSVHPSPDVELKPHPLHLIHVRLRGTSYADESS